MKKNLADHLYWIREFLDLGILTQMEWCDTREMVADAPTKGKVDRDMMVQAMGGRLAFKLENKVWKPQKIRKACDKGKQATLYVHAEKLCGDSTRCQCRGNFTSRFPPVEVPCGLWAHEGKCAAEHVADCTACKRGYGDRASCPTHTHPTRKVSTGLSTASVQISARATN